MKCRNVERNQTCKALKTFEGLLHLSYHRQMIRVRPSALLLACITALALTESCTWLLVRRIHR